MKTATRPLTTFAGRYRPSRSVKHDQGVATFAGTDTQTGEPVIIKTVPAAAVSTCAVPAGDRHDPRHRVLPQVAACHEMLSELPAG